MIDASTEPGRRLLLDLIQAAERQDGRLPSTRRLTRYTPEDVAAVRLGLQRHQWGFEADTVVVHVRRIIDDDYSGSDEAFLEAAYTATGTKPTRRKATDKATLLAAVRGDDDVAHELRQAIQEESGWIRRSLNDGTAATVERLNAYQAVASGLPMAEETPYRAAVQRLTGRSHALDDDTILRRALTQHVVSRFGTDLDDDDAWLQAGVNRSGAPSVAQAFGRLRLDVAETPLDGSRLAAAGVPLAVSLVALQQARVTQAPDWALFIENQATWLEACKATPPHGLVILTDGMPNRAVRTLHALLADVPRYHWGDVDVGGHTILRHLPGCEPLFMDEEAVRANQDRLHPFKAAKRDSFQRRLERHPPPLERNALKASLELNGWLEQEAIPATHALQSIGNNAFDQEVSKP